MRSMEFLDKIFAGKKTTRARGEAAEDLAWAHLRAQAKGLQLLARNYRTPGRGGVVLVEDSVDWIKAAFDAV